MRMKDNCLYFSTEGQQLNFSVMLCMLSSIGFFIMDSFEKAGWINLTFAVLKGVFAVGAIYLLLYSAFLSRRLTEKFYK